MRAIKVSLIFTILVTSLFGNPNWYRNIKSNNTIIGFGEGKSKKESVDSARVEIAETIEVQVQSTNDITTKDDKTSLNFKINTQSKQDLINSKIIKIEKQNGIWYSAVEYSNLPSVMILSNKLKNMRKVKNFKKSYLNYTKFGKQLKKLTGYDFKLDLYRYNNSWYIRSDSVSVRLRDTEFFELFISKQTDNYFYVPYILHRNQTLFFEFDSKNKYRTLLCVESDGKVGIIAKNLTTTVKLSATELNAFETINEKVLDDSNYKFDELINILNKYEYSSTQVKIRG